MSKRRPAHTVTLILHRLSTAELGNELDPMELIGLHDELSRVERKWQMQIDEGSERRKPESDLQKLSDWFARLDRLIDRALRATVDESTTKALTDTKRAIAQRPKR
jgi:hypothetical protein